MHVVVVESPAKARTLGSWLGIDYTVIASYGHVSDLPAKDGSVLPERDFQMVYRTAPRAGRIMGTIRTALAGAESLVLATDPDREGEAIAWQVLTWLRERDAIGDRPVRRVAFHEITPDAVRDALMRPREIDMDLVHAQQARRALDYLVGFHLSPVLWRKIPGSRSAGRVQSVALRLICEREAAIEDFMPLEYWTVEAEVEAVGGTFAARLSHLDGNALGPLSQETATMAERAVERIRGGSFHVAALDRSEVRRDPPPPFTTAALQQDASRRLGIGVEQVMRIAQALYEGVTFGGETTGLITYMRTDSVALSEGAAGAARDAVRDGFGEAYLPRRARRFRSRARNAREAHEAIRPTGFGRSPEAVRDRVGGEAAALYALIWNRAVASRMAAARLDRVRADLSTKAGDVTLGADGAETVFDGFLRLYREGTDDGAAGEEDAPLPAMNAGEAVRIAGVRAMRRFTRPPPRYTEAGLVGRLEALGIGRPSTYAAIVGVLRDREYVALADRRFVATERGRVVTAFLEAYFGAWVAYGFTAGLERDLDRIAAGGARRTGILRVFWEEFEAALKAAEAVKRTDVPAAIAGALDGFAFGRADREAGRPCPSCGDGRLALKVGRRGVFVGCGRFPECRFTRPLAEAAGGDEGWPRPLGEDPASGLALSLRRGRFGHYVQRGASMEEAGAATVSVPEAMAAETVTPEVARALLALPREVGRHPESGEPILAGIGRYGPWLRHRRTYASIPADEDVLSIGINRAVVLIAEKEARGRGSGRRRR